MHDFFANKTPNKLFNRRFKKTVYYSKQRHKKTRDWQLRH